MFALIVYFSGELSSTSFEDIMRLQKQVGTKAYNKLAFGTVKKKQAAEPVSRLSKFRYKVSY